VPIVHHPALHVETDVPVEHVPILCGDGNLYAGYGWVEGSAPESWPRDDFGKLVPLADLEPEPEPKPTKSKKAASTTDDKDAS
jgi:hypothetical protein